MTTEPKQKQTLTAVAFVEPIILDGRRFEVVLLDNRDYQHLALSESPGFVLVTSDKSPDEITRVPLANVKWLRARKAS